MILKKADPPLEVVLLVINGMALLLTGILLFPVSTGMLPYYENGFYGLFLFFFALQTITLGKTPFGEMGRSKLLLTTGVMLAAMGIVVCFIPSFNRLPRLLLFLCFGPGGLLLLLQMALSKDKFQTWVKFGGIFRHLVFGCTAVYVLSMMISILLWKQSLLVTPMTAVVVVIYGLAVFYLASVLQKIYRTYPEAEKKTNGNAQLSMDEAMLLVMGVFMIILGVLLIPVNLGLLPFSGSAQLGLLMVIFAIQMLASGSTPIGTFPRSRLIISFGLLCAALGIISCIIPKILVALLTVLVGALNILGGVSSVVKICVPFLWKSDKTQGNLPPILVKLFITQLIMNLLTIMFGTSMLIQNLVPGLAIGVILAANGGVLLYMLHILIVLDKMQKQNYLGSP